MAKLHIPSRKPTYPTLAKGKPLPWEKDMLVPWRVLIIDYINYMLFLFFAVIAVLAMIVTFIFDTVNIVAFCEINNHPYHASS